MCEREGGGKNMGGRVHYFQKIYMTYRSIVTISIQLYRVCEKKPNEIVGGEYYNIFASQKGLRNIWKRHRVVFVNPLPSPYYAKMHLFFQKENCSSSKKIQKTQTKPKQPIPIFWGMIYVG